MPTVAAMIADPAGRRLTAEQVGTLAAVRFCDRVESLIEIVAVGNIDAVVADLHDATGVSVLPTLGLLHRQTPHLPLVLFCPPTPEAVRELPLSSAMFRGMTLVFRNCEHLGVALAALLESSPVPSAAETLARHVVPLVPAPFQPFVLVCACKASPRLRVRTAARWSGGSRRTLERSLRLAGLPSAGAVLGSCTALHAAWWLDVQGWSAKQVVADMQFSHASALSRVLRRHFGCTVKSLRDEGGFGELLYRFETTLLGGPVTSESARSA
jgi:AraC-like DNA-binding protein